MKEIWKDIKGYEGYYQVSNFGRIKSLKRCIYRKDGTKCSVKEKILKNSICGRGYLTTHLNKEVSKTYAIHLLVFDAFDNDKRNGRKLQVDHIDGDKKNPRFINLQLLTQRENISKGHQERGKELPTGVSLNRATNKFVAQIWIGRQKKGLGYFQNPTLANKAYQKALRSMI